MIAALMVCGEAGVLHLWRFGLAQLNYCCINDAATVCDRAADWSVNRAVFYGD